MDLDRKEADGIQEHKKQIEEADVATRRMLWLVDAFGQAETKRERQAFLGEFRLAREDARRAAERCQNASSKWKQRQRKLALRTSPSASQSSSSGRPQDTSCETKETTLEALIRRSQIVRQCKIAGPSHDTTLALVELPDGGGFLLAIGFPNPGASSSFQHVRGKKSQALTVYAGARKRLERQARQEWVSESPQPQDARANAKAKPLLSRWTRSLS